MFNREAITSNGKAAFYASIYHDLCRAAHGCGWALGLHGSLSSDMDIMAMPWTEDAKPVEEVIQALSGYFDGNIRQQMHGKPYTDKPNNRVVYTMAIWADYYLDINVIAPEYKSPKIQRKLRIADAVEAVFENEGYLLRTKLRSIRNVDDLLEWTEGGLKDE